MIAAIAALLLLIVMFIFSWFSLDASGEGEVFLSAADTDTGYNAWQSFGFIDIVLFVTILVAVGGALVAANATSVNTPVTISAVTAGLAILSFLLILFRVISPPSFGIPDNDFVTTGRGIGVWLGLILTAAIAYGGWRAMEDEGISLADQADRFRGGGTAPPPPPPPPPAS
jgi:heme A synthase